MGILARRQLNTRYHIRLLFLSRPQLTFQMYQLKFSNQPKVSRRATIQPGVWHPAQLYGDTLILVNYTNRSVLFRVISYHNHEIFCHECYPQTDRLSSFTHSKGQNMS